MKNITKSALFLTLICFFITSCSSTSTTKSLLTKEMSLNLEGKTLIVYRILAGQTWSRLDNHYGTKKALLYNFKGPTFTIYDNYNIHVIEPGTYTLDYLCIGCLVHGVEVNNIGKYELVTFNAKPGEIIYVGDIDFSYKHTGLISAEIQAKIINNYEDAKVYLSRERPDINSNILKKELAVIKPEMQYKYVISTSIGF